MSRTGWQLAARTSGGTPHETSRALNRARCYAGPNRTPGQMSDWHHGMRLNCGVRIRENLIRYTCSFEHETGAAGASHPKGLPVDDRFDLIILPKQGEQHLVGG